MHANGLPGATLWSMIITHFFYFEGFPSYMFHVSYLMSNALFSLLFTFFFTK